MFEELERIAYQFRDRIFQEGDVSNCAYLIESGAVEISVHRENRPFKVSTLEKGDLFGEMALIDNQPRTATAIALCETHVVSIPCDLIEAKLDNTDPVIEHLLRLILKRFRKTHYILSQKDKLKPEETEKCLDEDFSKTQEDLIEHIRIASDIAEALKRNEFQLYYQPIISIKENRIVGFEALCRWFHPKNGLMLPTQFINIAESTGQILSIGLWSLEQVSHDLKKLSKEFHNTSKQAPLFISVNMSARQLANNDHVAQFINVFERTEVDPACIKLEVTETMLISEQEDAKQTLTSLSDQGFRLSLDDFGTGYSSLSHLQKFPVDDIKIDRSFISHMLSDFDSAQIVQASIGLAKLLELEVIAEGVESKEEANQLIDMQCDYAQGYYFAKPLPLPIAVECLKNNIEYEISNVQY